MKYILIQQVSIKWLRYIHTPGLPWNGKPISTVDLDNARIQEEPQPLTGTMSWNYFYSQAISPPTDTNAVELELTMFIQRVVSISYSFGVALGDPMVKLAASLLCLAFARKGTTCPRVHE
jgi:hypothetical protein